MDDGGFQRPSGRYRRIWGRHQPASGGRLGRQRNVERALSASTLLPTTAFAALGAMTVLVVTQMGMSPLGALGDPTALSARDGGRAVTSPRMSISSAPPLANAQPPADDRAPTRVRPSPTTIPVTLAVRPQAKPAVPVVVADRPDAKPAAPVVVAVLTGSTKEPVAQPVPESPQGQFAPAATLATTTATAEPAVNVIADEPAEHSESDQSSESSQAFRTTQPTQPAEVTKATQPAEVTEAAKAAKHSSDAKPANNAKDATTDRPSDRVRESRAS